MTDSKSPDHVASEKLTRALGHTIAEWARYHQDTRRHVVMAAAVNALVSVGLTVDAPLDEVVLEVRAAWYRASQALRGVADHDAPPSPPASSTPPSPPEPPR